MNIKKDTYFLLDKYNIRADKSLGQNFLVNQDAIDGIVASSGVTKSDYVIEIGPGLGTLTNELVQKAGHVTCIELDKRMIDILHDRFDLYDNWDLINDDVLKVNLQELIDTNMQKYGLKKARIVANLPYYITTPIMMKLIENDIDIESITVMIQKEVAERLIAIPGTKETGAITYTVFYYCESKKIREVGKECFIPEPEVMSEVINLKLRKNEFIDVKDKTVMFKIIKSAFMQRRKTLNNSLTSVGIFQNKEQCANALKEIGIREDARPENLSLDDFAKLTNYFLNEIIKEKENNKKN